MRKDPPEVLMNVINDGFLVVHTKENSHDDATTVGIGPTLEA